MFSLFPFKVLVPKIPEFKAKMIEVDIYEAGKHFMKGRPVSEARVLAASIASPLEKGEVSGLTEVRRAKETRFLETRLSIKHSQTLLLTSLFTLEVMCVVSEHP